jgi:hypothetical protein
VSLRRSLSAHVLLVLAAAACRAGPTPIRDILAKPADFDGKTVSVSGTVTDATNVLVLKFYRVDDGTGRIAVVTRKAVPLRGTKVEATGIVHQAFVIGDESLTVLVEEDR